MGLDFRNCSKNVNICPYRSEYETCVASTDHCGDVEHVVRVASLAQALKVQVLRDGDVALTRQVYSELPTAVQLTNTQTLQERRTNSQKPKSSDLCEMKTISKT